MRPSYIRKLILAAICLSTLTWLLSCGPKAGRQASVLHGVDSHGPLIPSALVNDTSGKLGEAYMTAEVGGVIPFLAERGGARAAFVMSVESGFKYPLSAGLTNVRQPILSGAANRAAFIYGKESDRNCKLRMVDLATMEVRDVSTNRNVIDAAFAPDGFLYYIEADSGSNIGAVFKTAMHLYGAIPVLPPDGSRRADLSVSKKDGTLLFTARKGRYWHVYTADTASKTPTRVTVNDANHRSPRISANGRFIGYLSDHKTFGERMDLWVFDNANGEHWQITVNSNVRDFCWHDDSRTVYFSAGANLLDINSIDIRARQAGIKKMNPDRKNKTWSEATPYFIRYKDSPKIVYTREYVDGRRHLHWFDTKTMKDEALTSRDGVE